MMWTAVPAGVAVLAALSWAWQQRTIAAAAAKQTQLLTAALGTISGACYAIRHDHTTRIDINPSVDGWPPDLKTLQQRLRPADQSALSKALASFDATGKSFVLRVDWYRDDNTDGELATSAEAARARRVEITGHRLIPDGATLAHLDQQTIDLLWVSDVTDRSAATAEHMRASQELARLRETLSRLPITIWWRDQTLKVTGGNRGIQELLKISPHSNDLASEAVQTQQVSRGYRMLAAAPGVTQPLELIEQALGDGWTVGFAVDRTEIETVNAELGRLVLGHREVLESVSTAIAIYGPDTRLMFFNTAFVKLWGIDGGLLQSEPSLAQVLETLHEDRVLPEYADFRRFKAQELGLFDSLTEPREELMHLPDGRTIRLKVARHPFGGLTFIYDDVTDRIALERSYNTLIEVQRETLDNLFEGIAVFGSDGRIKLWNPTFAASWKINPEELDTRPHISVIADKARSLLENGQPWDSRKDEIVGIVTSQQPYSSQLERPDGRILDLSVLPLPDGNVLWTFLDVTDASRVQRALQERNEALEESGRLKSEFIANVSYELRTPLNAIIGFAEMLAHEYYGPLSDRQKDSAQGILEGSKRLLELIDDILDLATIEAGHMALERKLVDVHAMLSSVLLLARERAGRLELNLSLNCAQDIGSIDLDLRRIRQALYNLVTNAIKFTPAGGSIMLSARREDGEMVLVVADTGIGIALEDQPHVFEKFERGDRRGRQVGAGLGLALVKSFVELHGGRVGLVSEPGLGTHVTLFLPMSSPEPAPAPVMPSQPAPGTPRVVEYSK